MRPTACSPINSANHASWVLTNQIHTIKLGFNSSHNHNGGKLFKLIFRPQLILLICIIVAKLSVR